MPFNDIQEVQDAIMEAVKLAIQDTCQDIYDISQNTEGCYVPVKTGYLKSTGYISETSDGCEVGYLADYAHAVEYGFPFIPFERPHDMQIPSYRRKDGTIVRSHIKRVYNMKPVTFKPKIDKFTYGPEITRMMPGIPKQDGQFFLSRAVDASLVNFGDNLELHLHPLELI